MNSRFMYRTLALSVIGGWLYGATTSRATVLVPGTVTALTWLLVSNPVDTFPGRKQTFGLPRPLCQGCSIGQHEPGKGVDCWNPSLAL